MGGSEFGPKRGKQEAEQEGDLGPSHECDPLTSSDTGHLWTGPQVPASTLTPDSLSLSFPGLCPGSPPSLLEPRSSRTDFMVVLKL